MKTTKGEKMYNKIVKGLNKMIPVLVCLGINLIAASNLVYAEATGEGGADGFLLADGSLVISDPWIKRNGGPTKLHPVLEGELKSMAGILNVYLNNPSAQENFMDNLVLGSEIEYRFVKESELPTDIEECKNLSPIQGDLPGGLLKRVRLGCTHGSYTWINLEVFEKASIAEQVKIIFHERLHSLEATYRFPTSIIHEYIANVTSAIETVYEVFPRQVRGERLYLTDSQLDKMNAMLDSFCEFEISKNCNKRKTLKISRAGGYISGDIPDTDEVFISIGSIIDTKFPNIEVSIASNLSIINSSLRFWNYDKEKEHRKVIIGKNLKMKNSKIYSIGDIKIQDDVEVIDSKVSGSTIYFDEGSKVLTSSIFFHVSRASKIYFKIELKKNASIVSSNLQIDSYRGSDTRLLVDEGKSLKGIKEGFLIGQMKNHILLCGPAAPLCGTVDMILFTPKLEIRIISNINFENQVICSSGTEFVRFKSDNFSNILDFTKRCE